MRKCCLFMQQRAVSSSCSRINSDHSSDTTSGHRRRTPCDGAARKRQATTCSVRSRQLPTAQHRSGGVQAILLLLLGTAAAGERGTMVHIRGFGGGRTLVSFAADMQLPCGWLGSAIASWVLPPAWEAGSLTVCLAHLCWSVGCLR